MAALRNKGTKKMASRLQSYTVSAKRQYQRSIRRRTLALTLGLKLLSVIPAAAVHEHTADQGGGAIQWNPQVPSPPLNHERLQDTHLPGCAQYNPPSVPRSSPHSSGDSGDSCWMSCCTD